MTVRQLQHPLGRLRIDGSPVAATSLEIRPVVPPELRYFRRGRQDSVEKHERRRRNVAVPPAEQGIQETTPPLRPNYPSGSGPQRNDAGVRTLRDDEVDEPPEILLAGPIIRHCPGGTEPRDQPAREIVPEAPRVHEIGLLF